MEWFERQMCEFLLQLHDSSRSLPPLSFQQQTLHQLRGLIDFDFAIWGAGDGLDRHVHTATILDQDPHLFETWEPVKHEDPFANLVIGNTGQTWTLADLPAKALKTRAYNEHWRRYDARQMLSTMEQDRQTGLHLFVTLCRDNKKVLYSEKERQLKGLVTHHLFLAARHNELFTLLGHREPAGVAIIDWRGTVHSSVGEFDELVAQEWKPSARQRLPLDLKNFSNGTYMGRQLHLSFTPLGDRFIAKVESCSMLNKLSVRERQIALAYAQGKSHKEVAQALAISPHTVRQHLQSIYQKLKIKNKAALALYCSRIS